MFFRVTSLAFTAMLVGCSGQALDAGNTGATDGGSSKDAQTNDASGLGSLIGIRGDAGTSCASSGLGGITDQFCNADPKISSILGRCDKDGQCRCEAGSQLIPGGRCARVIGHGLGGSCQGDDECAEGLRCLSLASHPSPTTCESVGKMCSLDCSAEDNLCQNTFGPAAHCFQGCSVGEAACGLLAESK